MSTSAPIASTSSRVGAIFAAALTAFTALPAPAAAAPSKEECVDAHGKGQDAREGGQLVLAGKLFLTCAQPSCPDLVRSDCARFVDELERQTPSVTFAARDGAQNDLPDTQVQVDGTLVASRLGDGKAHEFDPGHHEVRFLHAGREVVLDVVVSQGEKGRALVGTFLPPASGSGSAPAPAPASASTLMVSLPPLADTPGPKRPSGPLVLVGLGAAAAVVGGALLGVGLAKVPANCNLATHACAAPPQDPVFDQASRAVTLANVGAIVGVAGVVTFGGSLIGYFAQSPRPSTPTAATLRPWFGPGGAGISFAGAL